MGELFFSPTTVRFTASSPATLTISNSDISFNQGIGLSLSGPLIVTIEHTTIWGNYRAGLDCNGGPNITASNAVSIHNNDLF